MCGEGRKINTKSTQQQLAVPRRTAKYFNEHQEQGISRSTSSGQNNKLANKKGKQNKKGIFFFFFLPDKKSTKALSWRGWGCRFLSPFCISGDCGWAGDRSCLKAPCGASRHPAGSIPCSPTTDGCWLPKRAESSPGSLQVSLGIGSRGLVGGVRAPRGVTLKNPVSAVPPQVMGWS